MNYLLKQHRSLDSNMDYLGFLGFLFSSDALVLDLFVGVSSVRDKDNRLEAQLFKNIVNVIILYQSYQSYQEVK